MRYCARHLLYWPPFPFVSALGSPTSLQSGSQLAKGALVGESHVRPRCTTVKPMLSGDAKRPPSFERVLERLGFPEPLEWIVHPNVINQRVDCDYQLGISPLPVLVILQCLARRLHPH